MSVVWSWRHVRPADERRLVVALDGETLRRLQAVARVAGATVQVVAAGILRDVMEDDAVAHAVAEAAE